MAKDTPKNERWWWRYLYKEKRKSVLRREAYDRRLRVLFPRGYRDSMRRFVPCLKSVATAGDAEHEPHFQYVANIHPDAFDIIERYGIDYTPHIFRKRPPFGEPKAGQCYVNAATLSIMRRLFLEHHPRVKDRRQMTCVVGIVVGSTCHPMLHAWNAWGLHTRKGIDWTLYATCKWTRYLGIPFTFEEWKELSALTGRMDIFAKDCFSPDAKRRCIEILKTRRKKKTT